MCVTVYTHLLFLYDVTVREHTHVLIQNKTFLTHKQDNMYVVQQYIVVFSVYFNQTWFV